MSQESQENFINRLSAQIESLQGAFRKLSKAATLKDLAGQFIGVVRDVFPAATIDLLYRPAQSEQWQKVVDSGTDGTEGLLSLPPGGIASAYSIDETFTRIRAVQRLVDGSFIGMVLVRENVNARYTEIDAVSLRLFIHLFDSAYQEILSKRNEKELIFSLNHRVLQLNSLIDTGIEVSKLHQDASPQQLALERAASLTNASKGLVRVRSADRLKEEIAFPGGARLESTPEGKNRIATSFTFAGDTYMFELYEKESRSGIIPFEDTDQLLLDALARQVHASLENRYLHQQALEKQKIEQDIAVAASIQQRILPTSLPTIKGYDIAGINIPSKSVGGDYYDCIPLTDGKYALVVADVAGKGVPAALLVSSLHAYLSAYLESTIPLDQLVRRLNTVIYNASTDDKFITAFIVLLSPETGEIESLSAGHNPAYLLRKDDTIQELNTGGVALGMLDMDFPYQTERVTIEPGERLLLYTDGVTEATNEQNRLYDADVPLQQFVFRTRPERAELFIQSLISDIKRFTGNAPQNDDITALYLLRR
jgi:sigma-B regulation protein RsbU (phosphoserine phosphatase)